MPAPHWLVILNGKSAGDEELREAVATMRGRGIALGVRVLAERGLTIPSDVAIVGFDDIPAASFTSPPLTTVSQDVKAAGEALVDTLLRKIRGQQVEPYTLPTQLVVRGSSG